MDPRDKERLQVVNWATKSLHYWLGKVGGALWVPRPCHVKQNPAATAAFRAELEQNLEKLKLAKDRPVKIWVADEARFGWQHVEPVLLGLAGPAGGDRAGTAV